MHMNSSPVSLIRWMSISKVENLHFSSHSLKVQHENSALEFGITNQKVIIFNTTTVIHLIWFEYQNIQNTIDYRFIFLIHLILVCSS